VPPQQPPAARPYSPQPVAPAPPPIWTAAAVDPTAPMGRRIFAVLVDAAVLAFLISVIAGGLFVWVLFNSFEHQPATFTNEKGESVTLTCEDDFAGATACRRIGDTIYHSDKRDLPSYDPFTFVGAALAVPAMFVLVQGLTGATVGKFLTGLRVVDRDGRPPGLGRATVRTLLLAVDACPWVVPLLGWAVAVTHPRHRRLGDLAAGTIVVRRKTLPYIRR
jgi:uncharacterized RDD family membrane protein YckC